MCKQKKQKRNTPMRDVMKRLRKNRMAMAGLIILVIILLVAILAPLIIPYPYDMQDYDSRMVSPNSKHWFGTDNFGRDIFSRILYGSRYTLTIGFGCITIACLVGTLLGAVAAYFPKADNLIMRSIDIIMGIPTFMLALSIIVALGSNMKNLMIALSITSMPTFARVTRAQVLTIKEQEFIEAAR